MNISSGDNESIASATRRPHKKVNANWKSNPQPPFLHKYLIPLSTSDTQSMPTVIFDTFCCW